MCGHCWSGALLNPEAAVAGSGECQEEAAGGGGERERELQEKESLLQAASPKAKKQAKKPLSAATCHCLRVSEPSVSTQDFMAQEEGRLRCFCAHDGDLRKVSEKLVHVA